MVRVKKSPTPRHKPKALPEPKPRACHACKRQKIFCSKHQPKCERCQAKNLECSYAKPKKILVNEDKLRFLKAKLKRYEEIVSSLPQDVIRSLPPGLSPLTTAPEGQDDYDDDDDDDNNASEADETDETLPGQFQQMSLYLKASRGSADTFLQIASSRMSGLRGDDAGGESGTEPGVEPGTEPTSGFYHPGRLPRKPLGGRGVIELPPVDVARQYFFAQHMYIGTIFAFSDPETFEKQLDAAYDNSPLDLGDTQACLTYAKILMILALGRLYSVNRGGVLRGGTAAVMPDGDDHDHPPGFIYFSHALALLPDVHEPGSILGVETLAYVGYFLQNMNRRDAAFLYIGLALRMAISLGLHQEIASTAAGTASETVSDADREHRRRVWWSIYSLDRILSLKSGHPVSILDEDVSVRMPSRLPGEANDSPVVVLCCYTELSRILGTITALIYRRTAASKHTGQTLIRTVHAILQSLMQWEEALPKTLRLDPDPLDHHRGNKLSRESISMYLHYYQCINMTARPLLFHVVQKRIRAMRSKRSAVAGAGATTKETPWQTSLSDKTVAVIRACMSAARNTVQFMSKAADHNMVATYGYMDGEHAFSAAIVLALVHTAFPTDAATEDALGKGLALLRRMGELGNSYVASRYQRLARLQTMLEPPRQDPVEEQQQQQQQQQQQHQYQQPQHQHQQQQQHHQPEADYAGEHRPYHFSLDLDSALHLADIDGIMFMDTTEAGSSAAVRDPYHAGAGYNVSSMLGHAQTQPTHSPATPSDGADPDENTMWTTAFTNPAANFDLSLLMAGESDMQDILNNQV